MTPLPSPDECRRILREEGLHPAVVEHVEAVAAVAHRAAQALRDRGNAVDVDLVHVGALLHDVGRSKTHGLDHATRGADLLRSRGLPEPLCLCVERHTGGGIDLAEAKALGLPPRDCTPRTLEEKLVCHIDNLFDGSKRQPLAKELEYLRSQNLDRAAVKVKRLHHEISTLLGMDLDRFA
ncbi:MAG TPA: HDIG domain-containing protein [Candidatus Thermoplasmatota archaeon]|nr:HDIG domain-containing protein [Candidatus Thermoplasmatota archaeon]